MTTETDLFAAEKEALARAEAALAVADLAIEPCREALTDLTRHYRRLIRETHRLIRHGDRTEAELNTANGKLQQLSAELDHKARHDSLTGTLNRSAIFDKAQHYLQDAPLSLILLDIDWFKRINDTFGHPAGDAVLRELVERLRATLAGRGDIGRVGGEEFTILLPGTPLSEALGIVESVRRQVAEQAFSCLPSHPVTASFGVSWNAPGTAFETAYCNADTALYRAKHAGRNRVEF